MIPYSSQFPLGCTNKMMQKHYEIISTGWLLPSYPWAMAVGSKSIWIWPRSAVDSFSRLQRRAPILEHVFHSLPTFQVLEHP